MYLIVIHKLLDGLTYYNYYFYPDELWLGKHNLYRCRLECVVYSRIDALLDLGNAARPSKKILTGPVMFIYPSR